MRDKKDEKLNELFREFAESGKMPDERVTQSAKQILECPETVPELALAPATLPAQGEARPLRRAGNSKSSL